MTGADYIAECLAREGVSKVFGQCGHTNLALIDALPKVGIDFVSFRHEQLAAHAADAYFRASHKLAVVLVHLSPGLTNALTGVVTAAADLTPMVVISGNTPAYNHARDAHQCIRFHAEPLLLKLRRQVRRIVGRSVVCPNGVESTFQLVVVDDTGDVHFGSGRSWGRRRDDPLRAA